MVVMPPEARLESYREVDVAEGDVLLVINGERVRELAKAREIYDATAIGGEVALGVVRDGQNRIVRFVKADPATLPQSMSFHSAGGHGGVVERRMVFQGRRWRPARRSSRS